MCTTPRVIAMGLGISTNKKGGYLASLFVIMLL